jgi:hypothetical protein
VNAVSVKRFQALAAQRQTELAADLGALAKVTDGRAVAQVEKARHAVEVELGLALLPDLTPKSCDRAARLTGFLGITADPPAVALEAERQSLTARLAAIAADERFQKREHLAHPDTGELVQRKEELLAHRLPFTEFTTRCDAHPRFRHLIGVGYDTPAYAVPFWRSSYYQDWKAGDEIVELFPERATDGRELRFADLRATWLDHLDSITALNASLHAVEAELAAVSTLTRNHAQLGLELAALDSKHLDLWRERLISHLRALGLENLDPALETEPAIARLVKALDGLDHKARYLESVAAEARTLAKALTDEKAKLAADLAKSQRPKAAGTTFDGAAIQKRFVERPTKLRTRISNLSEVHTTVRHYDDWSAARIGQQFLWWDVMTDGRLDGDFIDEVREHHHAPRDDGNAAAAVAGGMAAGVLAAGAADMAFDAS